jgi:hypothetical protein
MKKTLSQLIREKVDLEAKLEDIDRAITRTSFEITAMIKECQECGKVKNVKFFNLRGKNQDGSKLSHYRPQCKECENESRLMANINKGASKTRILSKVRRVQGARKRPAVNRRSR